MTDEQPPNLFEQVHEEGESWDTLLDVALPIAAGLGAAWTSPAVADAGTDGWLAVFFATLTWSLGCALTTFLGASQRLAGPALAWAASLSFLGALLVAGWLGTGVLDVSSTWAETSGPPYLRIPLAFLLAAVETYGVFGMLLGGALGCWLGYRVAQRVPSS